VTFAPGTAFAEPAILDRATRSAIGHRRRRSRLYMC